MNAESVLYASMLCVAMPSQSLSSVLIHHILFMNSRVRGVSLMRTDVDEGYTPLSGSGKLKVKMGWASLAMCPALRASYEI